jgi:beta-galactosidase beta subunit
VTERRFRDIAAAIEQDLAGTGVGFEFLPHKKYLKVRLHVDNKERLIVMSKTGSDNRAAMNRARDIRHAVRELTGV